MPTAMRMPTTTSQMVSWMPPWIKRNLRPNLQQAWYTMYQGSAQHVKTCRLCFYLKTGCCWQELLQHSTKMQMQTNLAQSPTSPATGSILCLQ